MHTMVCAPRRPPAQGNDPVDALVMFASNYRAVLSPCIGVCALDPQGYCEGCHRSAGEIARWPQMSDDERLRLMTFALPEREAQRA